LSCIYIRSGSCRFPSSRGHRYVVGLSASDVGGRRIVVEIRRAATTWCMWVLLEFCMVQPVNKLMTMPLDADLGVLTSPISGYGPRAR
jgi:hypothetical protein